MQFSITANLKSLKNGLNNNFMINTLSKCINEGINNEMVMVEFEPSTKGL